MWHAAKHEAVVLLRAAEGSYSTFFTLVTSTRGSSCENQSLSPFRIPCRIPEQRPNSLCLGSSFSDRVLCTDSKSWPSCVAGRARLRDRKPPFFPFATLPGRPTANSALILAGWPPHCQNQSLPPFRIPCRIPGRRPSSLCLGSLFQDPIHLVWMVNKVVRLPPCALYEARPLWAGDSRWCSTKPRETNGKRPAACPACAWNGAMAGAAKKSMRPALGRRLPT